MNTDLRDILISRAVDGRARPEDWEAIERLAQAEPALWRDLALAQRDDRALASAVMHQASRADHVALPEAELAEMIQENPRAVVARRTRLAATWSGWAAAALVAIAAVSREGNPGSSNELTPRIAALPGAGVLGTASDALDRYLDLGKKDGTVLGEMPEKLLVRTSKRSDGDGYEVVYVRQIVERARVPGLYKLSSDEAGNATPVPITVPITIPHMDILPTGDDGPM
jgi:hypothetical protein